MTLSYICDWTEYQGDNIPATGIQGEGFAAVKLKVGGSLGRDWSYRDRYFLNNANRVTTMSSLIPMAYWYLQPWNPIAQAGLFLDTMCTTRAGAEGFAAQVDCEHPDLTTLSIGRFVDAWKRLTDGRPLFIYTRRNWWEPRVAASKVGATFGNALTPFLEEAHWVPEAIRADPVKPYASQQAKAIGIDWWNVDYSGWKEATLLQFTDNALVAERRTTASAFRGTKEDLRKVLGL